MNMTIILAQFLVSEMKETNLIAEQKIHALNKVWQKYKYFNLRVFADEHSSVLDYGKAHSKIPL